MFRLKVSKIMERQGHGEYEITTKVSQPQNRECLREFCSSNARLIQKSTLENWEEKTHKCQTVNKNILFYFGHMLLFYQETHLIFITTSITFPKAVQIH